MPGSTKTDRKIYKQIKKEEHHNSALLLRSLQIYCLNYDQAIAYKFKYFYFLSNVTKRQS